MGINCPDVRHVIHGCVPADAEMYIQESGRGGRDELLSCATILYGPANLDWGYTTEHMIRYCSMLFVVASSFLKILLAAVLLQKVASTVTNVCCHVAVINVMRT